jgi:hypothetical protein
MLDDLASMNAPAQKADVSKFWWRGHVTALDLEQALIRDGK